MKNTFQSAWWFLELPSHWIAQEHPQCATFLAQPPIGALQISSARKLDGPVSDMELKEFGRERLGSDEQLRKIRVSAFEGFTAQHEKGDRHWQEWWLRAGTAMLYVTYNCSLREKGLEDKVVRTILTTLGVRDQSGAG